jgi:hypothetical protein
MDLFGLSKTPETQEPPVEAPAEPTPPTRHGSQGLWLFLLVLDSIFVAVFGGAVAVKIYQYWKAPDVVVAQPVRRKPMAKPSPAPSPAPAPAAAPSPAPKAAAPEAPRPAARAAKAAEGPRPPKPSLLNEPPRPRSMPQLAASGAPAAAAPAAAPGKALPVVFKIRAPKAGTVQLIGAFIVHGGRKEMSLGDDGIWTVKLYLNPGQYRYFFSVDRKKTLDPENPKSDRGASVLSVP